MIGAFFGDMYVGKTTLLYIDDKCRELKTPQPVLLIREANSHEYGELFGVTAMNRAIEMKAKFFEFTTD